MGFEASDTATPISTAYHSLDAYEFDCKLNVSICERASLQPEVLLRPPSQQGCLKPYSITKPKNTIYYTIRTRYQSMQPVSCETTTTCEFAFPTEKGEICTAGSVYYLFKSKRKLSWRSTI